MAIVSISEAARITGKARSTIQSYIKSGKLSKTTDGTTGVSGVDISEITRVFGSVNHTEFGHVASDQIIHQTTGNNTANQTVENHEIKLLKQEIEMLKKLLDEKDDHNNSLKQSMLLLEHKQEAEPKKKPWWKF